MDRLIRRRRTPAAFTLVEILTVIVIIGILAGLITVAARSVQVNATRHVTLTQITELGTALETYKTEYGDYPPDFAATKFSGSIGDAARARVLAHLRKAFPKYNPGTWAQFCTDVNTAYPNINPANFDASSGLVFWLGGLPERPGDWSKPAGFHSDPRMPFKSGLPRTTPPYQFDIEDLQLGPGMVYYCPKRLHEKTPVVYFRSYRSVLGRFEYGVMNPAATTLTPKSFEWTHPTYGDVSLCVPYLAPPPDSTLDFTDPAVDRPWRNLEGYQIICAGFDGNFGDGPTPFRFTKSGVGFSLGDSDNLTNFYSAGDLEGELQ